MRTYFYGRSLFSAITELEIPSCFIELDESFGEQDVGRDVLEWLANSRVALAENLCRRFANVDWYALKIGAAQDEKNVGSAVHLVQTLLVGYFSSAKSLLDAAAITLDGVLALGLSHKKQDLSQEWFWRALESSHAERFRKYKPFRSLSGEVNAWRHAAVHRVTPIVLPSATSEELPRDQISIGLINDPEPTMEGDAFVVSRGKDALIDPLDLHSSWRPKFVELSRLLCEELT